MWWYTPIILPITRWRQEDQKVKVIFSYMVSSKPRLHGI